MAEDFCAEVDFYVDFGAKIVHNQVMFNPLSTLCQPSEGDLLMLVKFSTLAGGVFIEDNGSERKPTDRCFRFDAKGNAEWAYLGDLTSGNPAPRWYGFALKADQFVFA